MKICSIQSFSGRNIYSHRPVVKIVLDLESYCGIYTKDITGFNENILKLLPGLYGHYCSTGRKGGFVERLHEGTYLGHVIEHVALELQAAVGYDVFFGKTRLVCEPSLYYIIIEYGNERCGIECAKSAVEITRGLLGNSSINPDILLENIRKISVETELGPSSRAIFNEAVKRNIPVIRLGDESLLQLGYGKHARLVEASLTDSISCIAVDMAGNKLLTKRILASNGIPVPYGDVAYTEDSSVMTARDIGYPVVLKPLDSNQGKGVTLDIRDDGQVREAYYEAIRYSKAVIVERLVKGRDYRALVIGDRVAAVSERRPPSVEGDGIHTIEELVELENMNHNRGDDHEKPLTKIRLDSVSRNTLTKRGINENYVPAPGEKILLRDNANLSTGGTARDCTEEIHPSNCLLAVKAAKAIGLDIAGVDITAEDISVPLNGTNGAVIEINAAPGLRMHLHPAEGHVRNVAADIIDSLFPPGKPCTIPIVSITGTNGKTTTTRLVSHIVSLTGKKVGMTSTSGIFIGNRCISEGDNTGAISARLVLSSNEVEAAVFETARGGIIRKGLGYDLADVGVIVNISEDHLGLDGLNTLEDLAFAKSLVIEAIKPGGYAVLNADDRMTGYLLERAAGNIMLFSRQCGNPLIQRHINDGGNAVYVEQNAVILQDGGKSIHLLGLAEIPITFNGMSECNVENVLAAVSALHALGIPPNHIRMGLKTFKPDIMLNPGRFNIFDMGYYRIMLDYGHNPAGYRAVADFLGKIKPARLVGIIGMPGDRLDRNIREVGAVCSNAFSKIYIKEDDDLRDREPGEVAGILYDVITRSGTGPEDVEIVYSETKALEIAMLNAQPGDLIVMFYEKFDPAVELINRYREELEQDAKETVG